MTTSTTPPPALPHDPSLVRSLICGPDDVIPSPFPIYMKGEVEHGFRRGSKELGCPTANLPETCLTQLDLPLDAGVYFGWARVYGTDNGLVLPMVMSIGWNPYYKNTKQTGEVHILHQFDNDFYGKEMRVVILGFIRPEYNYASMEALIKDIETDKQVSKSSLDRETYLKYKEDRYFA